MPEPVFLTPEERSAYQPPPCRSCGATTSVAGWLDVSTFEAEQPLWTPTRLACQSCSSPAPA